VRQVILHAYDDVIDDFSPAPAAFQPPQGLLYLAAGSPPIGVWAFVPQNAVWWEFHMSFIHRGFVAMQATRNMFAWIWANTPCRRLTAAVPAYNRKACMFARLVGMKQFGVNERAFMRHGTLHDLILFGISKE
jgi:RimJ/RimL family protein N-acetyltransferase